MSDTSKAILDILAPKLTEDEVEILLTYRWESKVPPKVMELRSRYAMQSIDFTAEGNSHLFQALLTTGRLQQDYGFAVRQAMILAGTGDNPDAQDFWLITAPAAVRAEAFLKVWKEAKDEHSD